MFDFFIIMIFGLLAGLIDGYFSDRASKYCRKKRETKEKGKCKYWDCYCFDDCEFNDTEIIKE